MAVYDGTLYFVGNDGNTGRELFQYDGFSISLVQDIASGDIDSDPRDFAIYNSRLYFTASTPDRGREPYSFDGQTVRSTEIVTGPVSGGGIDPVVYDDGSGSRLFVTATDNVTGIELYAFSESDGPLPVELAQFDASTDGEAVRLAWKTTSETGNAGFEVQRQSVDGTSWTNLGFVEGGGTTSEAQTYRFEDASLPFAADSLQYRLKQVDTDGTTHLSDPVVIARRTVDEAELRSVYPNPTTRRATVEVAVPTEAEEARLELFDLLGRTVRTIATGIKSGRTTQTLEVSDLSPGVYFLRLRAAGTTTTQKLTVVR
jgi:ELWxxDGT repeat protein